VRLFAVITRAAGAAHVLDYVLASAVAPREDSEVAGDAALAANPDPGAEILTIQAASPDIDIDARNTPVTGSGPAKVFYEWGTDWAGRTTQHAIAAKDQGSLFTLPWNVGTPYFGVFWVTYGGDIYRNILSFNLGNQPDTSPTSWALDPDAQASSVASQAAIDVDSKPPDWDSLSLYATGAYVHRAVGGGNWFAISDNVGIPPPNFWALQFGWLGLPPPDWDAVTSYIVGDFATTQPDGNIWYCDNANLNLDPRLYSDPMWGSLTITVDVNLSRLGADVTIEA
jgi:hypothetical protein